MFVDLSTWSPSHFLDDAEMTTAVAIGYDWCYDYLKPAKREIIEKAILEKAFGPAWPIYEKEGKTPSAGKTIGIWFAIRA